MQPLWGQTQKKRGICKEILFTKPLGLSHMALFLIFGQPGLVWSFATKKRELLLAFSPEVLSPLYLPRTNLY